MEVSSIPAENNNGAPPSNTSILPPSTANTTNISQSLFSNDNLQSQAQKSPANLLNNNDNNLKVSQSETSMLFKHKDLAYNNDPAMDNSCKNSSSNEHCNNLIDQEMKIGTTATMAPEIEPFNETQAKKPEVDLGGTIKSDVDQVLDFLLSNLEPEHDSLATLTASQSTLSCCADEPVTKVALITPVVEEEDASSTKDIVTLRNLEITPPPQPVKDTLFDETPTTTATTTPDVPETAVKKSGRKRKIERTQSETTEPSEGESTGGRSKRQRKQTELFQVVPGESASSKKTKHVNEKSSPLRRKYVGSSKKTQSKIPRLQANKARKSEPKPQKPNLGRQSNESQRDFQDVIYYEKNDYLAIRNEENTFFLCQLTENVRVQRPFVKIRWLDTMDNGKTYYVTSHYDKIPQKSIIMPVMLNKLEPGGGKGKPVFSIDEPIRETVMERLKRSLNIPTETFD